MNFSLLLPEISLFCGALIILMSDVFFGKKLKDFFYISHFLSLIFCAVSLGFTLKNFTISESIFGQSFLLNHFTSLVKSIVLTFLTIVVLMSLHFTYAIKKISAEFLSLLLIATVGGMILISANDFLVFYLGLELQALSLYLLAAINKKSAKSSEAGMKYFVLGSAASGILLFGISMIYGFSGTINFDALMQLYDNVKNVGQSVPVAVIFGFILVIVTMFFKISAAPFHMWTPDVYEGSSPVITTFFATVVKFIATLALLNISAKLLFGWDGIGKIFIFAAMLSLAIGSFGAIFQKNFKRLLAYSSIGHVGFVLLGIACFSKEGFVSSVLYMIIYTIASLGTFGFLILMRGLDDEKVGKESDAENEQIFEISSLSGLAKTNPLMAFSLAILMFSIAGIPPLAGFFSKFYILTFAIASGMFFPAIAAVLFSVVSAYYYLRIVKIMYFDEPKNRIKLEEMMNVKLVIFAAAIFNLALIFFLKPIFVMIANLLPF